VYKYLKLIPIFLISCTAPIGWGAVTPKTKIAVQKYQQAVTTLTQALSSETTASDYDTRIIDLLKTVDQYWSKITTPIKVDLKHAISTQLYPKIGSRTQIIYDFRNKNFSRRLISKNKGQILDFTIIESPLKVIQPWFFDKDVSLKDFKIWAETDTQKYTDQMNILYEDFKQIQRYLLAYMDLLDIPFETQSALNIEQTIYELWQGENTAEVPFLKPAEIPTVDQPAMPQNPSFGISASLQPPKDPSLLTKTQEPPTRKHTPNPSPTPSPSTDSLPTPSLQENTAEVSVTTQIQDSDNPISPLSFGEIFKTKEELTQACKNSSNTNTVVFLKEASTFTPYTCTKDKTLRQLSPEELRKHGLMGPKEIGNYLTYITYRSHVIRKYFEYMSSQSFAHYTTENHTNWIDHVTTGLEQFNFKDFKEAHQNTFPCIGKLTPSQHKLIQTNKINLTEVIQELKDWFTTHHIEGRLITIAADVTSTTLPKVCFKFNPFIDTTLKISNPFDALDGYKFKTDIHKLISETSSELRQFLAIINIIPNPILPSVSYINLKYWSAFVQKSYFNFWSNGILIKDQWISHLLYMQYGILGSTHECYTHSEEDRKGLNCNQVFEDRLPPYPFYTARGFFPTFTKNNNLLTSLISEPFLPQLFKLSTRFTQPNPQRSLMPGAYLISPILTQLDVLHPQSMRNAVSVITPRNPSSSFRTADVYSPLFSSRWEMEAVFHKMKSSQTPLSHFQSSADSILEYKNLIKALVPVVIPKSNKLSNWDIFDLKFFHRPLSTQESAFVIDFENLFLSPNEAEQVINRISTDKDLGLITGFTKVFLFGASFFLPVASLGVSSISSLNHASTLIHAHEWIHESSQVFTDVDQIAIYYKPMNYTLPFPSLQLPQRYVQDILPILSPVKLSSENYNRYTNYLKNTYDQKNKGKKNDPGETNTKGILFTYPYLDSEIRESLVDKNPDVLHPSPFEVNALRPVKTSYEPPLNIPQGPSTEDYLEFESNLSSQLSIHTPDQNNNFMTQLGNYDTKITKFISDIYAIGSGLLTPSQISEMIPITSQEILEDFGSLFQSPSTQTLIEFFIVDASVSKNPELSTAYERLKTSAVNQRAFHDTERNSLIYVKVTPIIEQLSQGFVMNQPGELTGIKVPHVFHKALIDFFQFQYSTTSLPTKSFTFEIRPQEVLYLNHANYGVSSSLLLAMSYNLNLYIYYTFSRLCMEEQTWQVFMGNWTENFRSFQNKEAERNKKKVKPEKSKQESTLKIQSILSNFQDKLDENKHAVYNSCHMILFYPMEAFPSLRDFATGDTAIAISTSLPTQDIESHSFRWSSLIKPLMAAFTVAGVIIAACKYIPNKEVKDICP
jgi:hypothetical protein